MSTKTPETASDDVTDVDRQIRLEQLATELAKRQAAIEADKERVEEIKQILAAELPVGTHPAGSHKIQVRAGARRLNNTRLAEAYPYTVRPELYKATLDTTAVKHHLAPAELESFKDASAPTVVVI